MILNDFTAKTSTKTHDHEIKFMFYFFFTINLILDLILVQNNKFISINLHKTRKLYQNN